MGHHPTMSADLTYALDGDVAVIRLDDGKANVLGHPTIAAAHRALDRAEAEARVVLIAGRPGQLSGGFDLKEMGAGLDRARDLVIAGARLHTRLFTFSRPVVFACTGNAVAAGAILLLVGDWNVGEAGDFRIGLPETAIGMPLPHFAVEYARFRLAGPHFGRATELATMYDPSGAVQAGYLDAVAEGDAVEEALTEARRLATTIQPGPFEVTRELTRGPVASVVLDRLVADVTELTTG
jgi:enoyl-CoA hydratase